MELQGGKKEVLGLSAEVQMCRSCLAMQWLFLSAVVRVCCSSCATIEEGLSCATIIRKVVSWFLQSLATSVRRNIIKNAVWMMMVVLLSQMAHMLCFAERVLESLFAAEAGASGVIAVEVSVKMASIATQIVKDNVLLLESQKNDGKQHTGVINVVQGMVEELDKVTQLLPHSVDVLVSEWMGYCLLYESMLASVLYAQDHYLKPDGAILPDTATIFVAGFGKGGTSLPFWDNVYGFNMSCIGKEIVEDAARCLLLMY